MIRLTLISFSDSVKKYNKQKNLIYQFYGSLQIKQAEMKTKFGRLPFGGDMEPGSQGNVVFP